MSKRTQVLVLVVLLVGLIVTLVVFLISQTEYEQSLVANSGSMETSQSSYNSTRVVMQGTNDALGSTLEAMQKTNDSVANTDKILLAIGEYNLKRVQLKSCDILLNLPNIQNQPGNGGSLNVEDLVMCQKAMDSTQFPALLTHLVDRLNGSFLLILGDNSFYVAYHGKVIVAEEGENTDINPDGTTDEKVFYDIPPDDITGVNTIALANCGDPIPQGTDNIVTIYPCSYNK